MRSGFRLGVVSWRACTVANLLLGGGAAAAATGDDVTLVQQLRHLASITDTSTNAEARAVGAKAYEAEAHGSPRGAMALEDLLHQQPSPSPELQRVTLVALGELARQRARRARAHGADVEHTATPDLAPAICEELAGDAREEIALAALGCVENANFVPTAQLVEIGTGHASSRVRRRALQLVSHVPKPNEALSRQLALRLAELDADHAEQEREADDICSILLKTTGPEAHWASLAAVAFRHHACGKLAWRDLDPTRESAERRQACQLIHVWRTQAALLCTRQEGGAAMLQVEEHLISGRPRYEPDRAPLPLHEGEELRVRELRYLRFEDTVWQAVPVAQRFAGVVVVPVSDRARLSRRLLVVGIGAPGNLPLLWQSPACSGQACRLDLVARERPGTHELCGLLLLTDQRAYALDVAALLERRLAAPTSLRSGTRTFREQPPSGASPAP